MLRTGAVNIKSMGIILSVDGVAVVEQTARRCPLI